jgi:hypothetical protein
MPHCIPAIRPQEQAGRRNSQIDNLPLPRACWAPIQPLVPPAKSVDRNGVENDEDNEEVFGRG